MTTLKMDETTARRLYPTASPEMKEIFESSFGKQFFSQKITDRIQNWQDVLDVSGIDPKTMLPRPGETDDELAYREWKLIAKVYNEGVELDASDTGQTKWFVWGNIVKDKTKPSGFGLSSDAYVTWLTLSIVGVRLCFKNREN